MNTPLADSHVAFTKFVETLTNLDIDRQKFPSILAAAMDLRTGLRCWELLMEDEMRQKIQSLTVHNDV